RDHAGSAADPDPGTEASPIETGAAVSRAQKSARKTRMATDQSTETHATETHAQQESTMKRLVDRSRRNFLLKVSVAMNGIVGAALAVPILGYLFGPVKKDLPTGAWIALGSLEKYPEGETRLATFRNP